MDGEHACIHVGDVVNMERPCGEGGRKEDCGGLGVSGSKVIGSLFNGIAKKASQVLLRFEIRLCSR